jgi:hypothetical protein
MTPPVCFKVRQGGGGTARPIKDDILGRAIADINARFAGADLCADRGFPTAPAVFDYTLDDGIDQISDSVTSTSTRSTATPTITFRPAGAAAEVCLLRNTTAVTTVTASDRTSAKSGATRSSVARTRSKFTKSTL